MEIRLSFVKNSRDTNPIDKVLSFEELRNILTTFTVCDKDNAPGIIGGYFNGKTRDTHNLQARTLLILDVDYYNGSINDLEILFKSSLDPHLYIAYSTASHALNAPRIRIILFFKEEVETKDYRQVSLNFINSLSEDFKKTIEITTSIKPNQVMYLPIKPHDDYEPWFSVSKEDKLIDPNLYLNSSNTDITIHDPLLLTIKNSPLEISEANIVNYLTNYPVEERDYYEWLEVGAALHHQYRGEDDGLIMWNKWSKRDPRPDKYKGLYELELKWNSFKTNLENPVTFATIIYKTNNNLPVDNGIRFRPIYREKWQDTKGKYQTPVFTKANFKILLQEYNIEIRFDVIKKVVEISFNGVKATDINHGITEIKLLCKLNGLESNPVNEAVGLLGNENTYNSWKDWVYSIPWDGIKRFDDFRKTVKVSSDMEKIRDLYLKKWFLQLINITCLNDEDEAKVARMILVFQGKQNSGKTSWFRSLVPANLNDFVTEGTSLKISDSMAILRCIQHVIVELGEISSTMKKSDNDELKNFLSSTKDTLNIKYVAYPVTYRRRTVFFGSVNENEFLQDQTDNTRFLCLPILDCDYRHNINMQQVYAELLEMTKTDNDYFLSSEDMIMQEQLNNSFKSISVIEEKFQEVFEVENALTQPKESMVVYNATKLLEELGFNINQMLHKKNLTNEMAKILDSYGFKRSSNPRGWYLPSKRINDIGF